jgi:23S rRNA pseudouridine1911/1915/1917 synthase
MRLVAAAAGRADRVLAAAIEGTSRSLLARAFADGQVRLNGRRARKGDAVAPGDVLEIDAAPVRAALAPVPEPERPLAVLFVDEHLVALDKPPGWPSMPLVAGERGTLANALVARHPECVAAGDDPREAGLAHRLDASTSGVLVAARTRAVWQALRAAFRAGHVDKEYLALVEGALEGPLSIDAPIAHEGGARGGVRADAPDGLEALTEVWPERRVGAYTLVRARARTGRMHQVRAHLAWAGHPCVGDVRYGAAAVDGVDGAFLHAARLAFAHPVGGAELVVEAALPAARRAFLDAAG